ncbi:xanthine dehydrogenase family protein subunit M [Candidatus Neomicrothrix sp.]|jgi:carbon-monoxide dehydrogenase medium subunit|uniref:xanthine dehydrogenase family protein subunit M n=1 Tax=Candidatus Neomicrothrix sp. TaxID=2719034 RepID=UPI001B469661|nr:xanthine dehydrogenase family protein subunit M [Candidatus Microthrix sp.]MBK6311610.1 xanthine dehydrogenase family protein subunit M [Candidatus Microthrix sp.]MBK6438010.1 xanthine dehydrogenase family protein subunit M [Candidatus Microthrix sp.]MBK6971093.1 xanthine dehydrogenase family protein subunit M [Candidatus Microthrix sp.]MBK7164410.1 xanthine dehydrogenase family protein subunit M [Candidatus Microthrix sp.]MBK9560700.1 xanthine dehydrogenase family protein subunit M [Candid
MIPAAFDYVQADSVEAALAALTEHGDEAKLMAGGHSLLPMMKLRLAVPEVIVDIGRIDDLSYIREDGDELAIGALTRHRVLESSDVLAQQCPILKHVAHLVGDPQVRHRGTIGGSLSHSDPASDLPAACLALGATLVAARADGSSRRIPIGDFYTGFLETTLDPTEMITEVRVPKRPGTSWNYQKFNRRAIDWAVVGVAAVMGNGSGGQPGVALVNMGSTSIRAGATEEALAQGATAADAAQLADADTEPPDDLNGSPEYRRHLVKVLTRRALLGAGVA